MRKMLTTARRSKPDEPLLEVDHAGLSDGLANMLQVWATEPCPPGGAFIEKTRVDNDSGDILGFNYYIVWDEPQRLGKIRVEIEQG